MSGLAWDLSPSLRQNSTVGLKKIYETHFFPLFDVIYSMSLLDRNLGIVVMK